MKKFGILIFGLLLAFSMNAQSDLTIGLVMPEEELNEMKEIAATVIA